MNLRATVPHACPLCGRRDGRELYRHRGRIVQCSGCGLVRQDPIPSQKELMKIYQADDYYRAGDPEAIGYADYFADEPIYRAHFQEAFELLARYAPPPGRLLEIGSAIGYALDEASRAGWQVEGLEVSRTAAGYARDRFGVTVRDGGTELLRGDEELDVIVAFQTIEHVPDVRAFLRAMRASLRDGGAVFLTTPDHGSITRRLARRFWSAYRLEHLLYFDRRSLRRLLEEEGFRVEHVAGDAPMRMPVRRLAEKAAQLYLARRGPIPLPDWHIPVWLGDMRVVARRVDAPLPAGPSRADSS